jgi:hypothetical protein
MSESDEQLFGDVPRAKDGQDYNTHHVFEEIVNFEAIADLAEDYRVWTVPGMLPGLEQGPKNVRG